MNDDPIDVEKIRRILHLAKAANNQQNPDQAIALIETLRLAESEGLEKDWADSQLILAEAYTAKGDQLAETLFEETFELLAQFSPPEITLEIRAHEHFGDYLRRFAKRPSLAHEPYEHAKSRAVDLHICAEDIARIQLKIEAIELAMDQSPEAENFASLKRVAKKWGYTCAEQLAAWLHHKGQADDHDQGLRFARNREQAGEQYFKYLLDMVRMKT